MAADAPDKGSPHDRARIVRRYLSALDARKPGRSNARTLESVVHRMHQIDTFLLSADPVQRLHLTQERIDLHAEQLRLTNPHGDFEQLEKAFMRVARSYGDRHDITYSAWRQTGVDTDVLARAGITQAPKANRPQPAATEAGPAKAEPVKAEPVKAEAEPAPVKAEPAKAEPIADGKPAEAAPVKKAPAAKKATKKAPAAKKSAPAKKAAAKPEQQRFPAEAHLLS